MKRMPDTSVIVPALQSQHENHVVAYAWLNETCNNDEHELVLAAHTLAEAYNVLTGLPPNRRFTPPDAANALQRLAQRATVIALTPTDYLQVINDLQARNLAGGIVYDALILAVARKADVDEIVTYNRNHFARVAPDLANRMGIPA